jgi:hypothetical protein
MGQLIIIKGLISKRTEVAKDGLAGESGYGMTACEVLLNIESDFGQPV